MHMERNELETGGTASHAFRMGNVRPVYERFEARNTVLQGKQHNPMPYISSRSRCFRTNDDDL